MATPSPLFDFGDPSRSGDFTPIDDAVMGGRSRSRAALEHGVLRFEGEVSLEDGGGFASIRSAPAPFNLTGAAGLALRVCGDGKRYKINLRTDDGLDDVAWQASFDTATGGWEIILLPLELFAPVLRGRPAPQAGPLRPDRVRTVGILISDRQAGPFRLEISAVAGYAPDHGVVALPRPAAP
jgi:NADH dehydrogenase [ubiquinone] 1 alpha subcomplex assembly factor 1